MTALRSISIVGGGLAGLTLGIALRQRDVPVTLFEAGAYPRHRVCGEFLSGGGLDRLRELGLHHKLIAAGAVEARRAAFFSAARAYRPQRLPRPALCLSRHVLDLLLADEFRRLGGQLHERHRIVEAEDRPGWVRATGRRLDSGRAGWQWIGLKAHAGQVSLAAELEMHFGPHAYVGLCRLGAGQVNVCGLFAVRGPLPRLAHDWQELLRGPAGSVLRERLATAEFVDGSFSAVAGFNLRPSRAVDRPGCSIGDACCMIPPVTGNGMSMAIESACWAVEPLRAYSRGEQTWEAARLEVSRRCDAGLARRLRWASRLQSLLMRRGPRECLLALGSRCDWLWRLWFGKTR